MHIWVIEGMKDKDSEWKILAMRWSRNDARIDLQYVEGFFYKTRVVKYISTKGE